MKTTAKSKLGGRWGRDGRFARVRFYGDDLKGWACRYVDDPGGGWILSVVYSGRFIAEGQADSPRAARDACDAAAAAYLERREE